MNHETLLEEINILMTIRGLSSRALAKEVKIAHTSMQRFLNGTGDIQLKTLCKIADYLGLYVEFLYDEKTSAEIKEYVTKIENTLQPDINNIN